MECNTAGTGGLLKKGRMDLLLEFAGLVVFLIGGLAFAGLALGVARLLRPKHPTPLKLSTYECGPEPRGPAWIQFKVSYFLYALIFLLFDVETVFLYPWAVKFQVLPWFAFVEMFIFIGILVVGLWYAWKEGALEWK